MTPEEMTPNRRVKVTRGANLPDGSVDSYTGTVLDGGKIGRMFQIRPDDAMSPTMTTWAYPENCEPEGWLT